MVQQDLPQCSASSASGAGSDARSASTHQQAPSRLSASPGAAAGAAAAAQGRGAQPAGGVPTWDTRRDSTGMSVLSTTNSPSEVRNYVRTQAPWCLRAPMLAVEPFCKVCFFRSACLATPYPGNHQPKHATPLLHVLRFWYGIQGVAVGGKGISEAASLQLSGPQPGAGTAAAAVLLRHLCNEHTLCTMLGLPGQSAEGTRSAVCKEVQAADSPPGTTL